MKGKIPAGAIPVAHSWIPVSQSLPQYREEVLVTCGEEIGHCFLDHIDHEGAHWEIVGSSSAEEFFDVVAWQPAPKIPAWCKQLGARVRAAKKKGKHK